MRWIFLDTGVLALVTNPRHGEEARRCNKWLEQVLKKGDRVAVPEICDYELRRELIRGQKQKGLARLDCLITMLTYVPICTESMREAARLWAKARNIGRPTADEKALDADMILLGQVRTFATNIEKVIATTNPKHLGLFGDDARRWRDI